jgi:hypothetical protein
LVKFSSFRLLQEKLQTAQEQKTFQLHKNQMSSTSTDTTIPVQASTGANKSIDVASSDPQVAIMVYGCCEKYTMDQVHQILFENIWENLVKTQLKCLKTQPSICVSLYSRKKMKDTEDHDTESAEGKNLQEIRASNENEMAIKFLRDTWNPTTNKREKTLHRTCMNVSCLRNCIGTECLDDDGTLDFYDGSDLFMAPSTHCIQICFDTLVKFNQGGIPLSVFEAGDKDEKTVAVHTVVPYW